uniref:Uncharacterized protein n=1 Tax=Trieres chinensis TaxID=1514140 RepID=A0A7S2EFC0_TRICV
MAPPTTTASCRKRVDSKFGCRLRPHESLWSTFISLIIIFFSPCHAVCSASSIGAASAPTAALSLPPVPRRRLGSSLRSISALSPAVVARDVARGYRLRVAADPSFPAKSAAEVLLAAGTQFAAELGRRGGYSGVVREVDFVVAGILTAIAGKYYSMWKVAPTTAENVAVDVKVVSAAVDNDGTVTAVAAISREVPTNAFQPYLIDGKTRPTQGQRIMALITPVPSLFRAGFAASAIGYGLTALLIQLRSVLLPGYEAATVGVNILHACVFTGCFLALVSNLRYQILQGIIEPRIIDKIFGRAPPLRAVAIFLVRLGNGLLGSVLAIAGMRWLGLQRLKG